MFNIRHVSIRARFELAISAEIKFETSGSFAPKGYTALINFDERSRIFHVRGC